MTLKQFYITAWIIITLLAISTFPAWGESQPVSLKGRALKIEMTAHIDKFTAEVGIKADETQWAVMVLPALELAGPAAVYGWVVPPVQNQVPGEPYIWITLFTFHEEKMLELEPMMRRVVAAHEVGHMLNRCYFKQPNLDGLDRFTRMLRIFNSTVVKESCADIVSAELTSATDVLATLHFLKSLRTEGNSIMVRRIQVMARVVEREKHE